MLTGLRLENFALIDCLELELKQGMTVLTGETGAGKSLLVAALDALLGGGDPLRLLRRGSRRGRLEASFRPSQALQLLLKAESLLEPGDPHAGDELILSRDFRLNAQDRMVTRSRLNGVVVSRPLLLQLRPLLIDLTVQGQTRQFSRPARLRRWLDSFAGPDQSGLLATVAAAHRRWQQAKAAHHEACDSWQRLAAERAAQEDLLAQLEAAELNDPDEPEQLRHAQDRLAHVVRLKEGGGYLLQRLCEPPPELPSVLDLLGEAQAELASMAALDGELQPLRQRFLDLQLALQDAVAELEHYLALLQSDPDTLARLQERIALLRSLERRHGGDIAALISLRQALRQQLSPLASLDLPALASAEQEAFAALSRATAALTARRRAAADRLQAELLQALRPMALNRVRFEVELLPIDPTEHGADQVRFLFSANPDLPLAPLETVASGGEMARFLLALKTCLAATEPELPLLFDEIDTGVSGRVSEAMASLLRRLSRHRQVFCITHQPVVAAVAQHHLQVSKDVLDGETVCRVRELEQRAEREKELAALAGGAKDDARRYAAALLRQNR